MSKRYFALAMVAAAVSAVITVSLTRTVEGQAARPARTVDGKPNFNGVWQALTVNAPKGS